MARVVWKGAIAFGLVNIPVRLYTAVHPRNVQFHMMSPDGKCRLRRKLWCPETGEEFEYAQATRAVEVAPDRYVPIEPEEVARLRPDKGHTVEIEDFVELSGIDPVYYARPYYVGPGEGGARAYRLLVRAMEVSNRVGIGRFVLREKQYLAAIRPSGGGLVLETMHWHDEVADLHEVVDLPSDEVDERQLELATDLIDRLTRPFDASRYRDTFREQLEELVARKAAGERLPEAPSPKEPAGVPDLTEALRQSLTQRHPKKKLEKA